MIRRFFVCLSVLFASIYFITSCKQESPARVDDEGSSIKETVSKTPGKDLVIRDDKLNDNVDVNVETVQGNTTDEIVEDASNNDAFDSPSAADTRVYEIAEKLPEYPGGLDALNKYLSENTASASASNDIKKPVRTMISFIVETDGSLSNAHVAKSSGNSRLDNKAVEIVLNMPAWIPAQNDGQNIRMKYTVPVIFNPAQK